MSEHSILYLTKTYTEQRLAPVQVIKFYTKGNK